MTAANEIRRIGLLTSGGDCAGLNAFIRAVVNRAKRAHGWEVIGIRNGIEGLAARPVLADALDFDSVPGYVTMMSGTILGTTNRGDPFADRGYQDAVIAGYAELGLDALIGIGGDGSLAILRRLAEAGGWRLVGVPKTIDNDVAHTDVAIGFSTAVAVATEALDRLHFTAASHRRVMILEVMGRDAGHIALSAGIAGAADVVLIPEIPYTMAVIKAKIGRRAERGMTYSLVVVAESVRTEAGETVGRGEAADARYGGIGHYLAERIAAVTGAETRVTVLGHLQRGGIPSTADRLHGASFGVAAVDMVAAGRCDRMVALHGRRVTDVALSEVVVAPVLVDPEGALVHTARGLGICLGDQ